MGVQYLLPCTCGQTVAVEPGQAGQTVACRCGATLEVPTMRKLAALRRLDAEPSSRPTTRAWGIRQRIALVAVLLILGGIALGSYLFWNRPILVIPEPNRESIRQHLEALSPVDTWQLWQTVRSQRLDRRNPADDPTYLEAVFRYRLAMGAALFLVASGGGLVVVGFSLRP